jgi:hypothetical protein
VNWIRRHYWLLYLVWIVVCAALFLVLRGAGDPSRREGRILNTDASARAIQVLRKLDARRFAGYEVVHVAWAGRNEAGPANRWIVLCDRVPHTGLREAVVVELDAADGHLLVIRRPVS